MNPETAQFYDQVREFMSTFGHATPAAPAIPNLDVCRLRVKLHNEECVDELAKAVADGDLTKAFDSGLDGLFVVFGTLIAFGFSRAQVELGFAEVHRSNMTKAWTHAQVNAYLLAPDEERAGQSYIFSKLDKPIPGEPGEPREWVAIDPASGKIIRSPSYSPPNLEPILYPNETQP